MEHYLPRILDPVIAQCLATEPALLLEGPKRIGKTTTTQRVAKSFLPMQNPRTRSRNIILGDVHPSALLEGKQPRLIDEWQVSPNLWDTVCAQIGKENDRGQFILTASAAPAKKAKKYRQNMGSVCRLKMRPLSLFESGESNGSVSLKALFDGEELPAGKSDVTAKEFAFLICRGGWPQSTLKAGEPALQQTQDYFELMLQVDAPGFDHTSKNVNKLRALLHSYARMVSARASIGWFHSQLEESVFMSPNSVRSYLASLRNIFIFEDLPPWKPLLQSKTIVRTSPIRHFVDPSIAAAALSLSPTKLMDNSFMFTRLFEALCVRDLRVYADALQGSVYHYRDKSWLECSMVLQRADGSYGLFEITPDEDADHMEQGAAALRDLAHKIDTAKMKSPSFLALISATSPHTYLRKDGVMVIPLTCLRP